MLVERPGFPTRASQVLAREMASTIGATGCCELVNDIDIQRIAANTIDTYMTKTVMDRTHARLLQVADRLMTGETGSIALVAVLHTDKDRGKRGEQARRLSGDHFYNSYDQINYHDWTDQWARPPPCASK